MVAGLVYNVVSGDFLWGLVYAVIAVLDYIFWRKGERDEEEADQEGNGTSWVTTWQGNHINTSQIAQRKDSSEEEEENEQKL